MLLEHGADAARGDRDDQTPLDLAAAGREWRQNDRAERLSAVAEMLRRRGAELTPRSAVALGEIDWLRARHAAGTLANSPRVDVFAPASGLLTIAVKHDRTDMLRLLLDFKLDPDERMRVEGLEQPEYSWGMPLWRCADAGKLEMAEVLLQRGADPNGRVYASGSPVHRAYHRGDRQMIDLLERYGGAPDAIAAGMDGQIALAAQMLAGEVDARTQDGLFAGETVAEQLLWGAADGGHPEIVRMALERVDWSDADPRWYRMLWRPLPGHTARTIADRERHLSCLRFMLRRADANAKGTFGRTLLHDVAARGTPDEQVAFATMLLDARARVDVRDDLLKSTSLGWACRWGRLDLVKLLLERGADPDEATSEPWARPIAWAEKKQHGAVLAILRERSG